MAECTRTLQESTGQSVELTFADQGYTGQDAAQQAKQHGIELQIVTLPEAKKGFVLLPRRWVVERSFAWATRLIVSFRSMSAFRSVVFSILMLVKAPFLIGP